MTAEDLPAFAALLRRLGRPPGPVPPAVGRAIAGVLLADIRRRFGTGTAPDGTRWKPIRRRPNGGDKPLLDAGLLRASVRAVPTATGAAAFSTLPYAGLHQFGGTVRPSRAKYLAIPLTRAAKRAGSPRRFPRRLRFRPFRRRKSGGVMYEPGATGKAGTDHYLLLPEVTVPARPFLGASAAALADIDRLAAEWVAGQLPGA